LGALSASFPSFTIGVNVSRSQSLADAGRGDNSRRHDNSFLLVGSNGGRSRSQPLSKVSASSEGDSAYSSSGASSRNTSDGGDLAKKKLMHQNAHL